MKMKKQDPGKARGKNPKRDRAASKKTGVDSEWLHDLMDDEYADDDPISEEEAMDMARRFGGGR